MPRKPLDLAAGVERFIEGMLPPLDFEVEDLNVELATVYAQYKRALDLNGLKIITPAVAEALIQHQGKILNLNGLTELDLETAIVLSRYKGKLSLNGLIDMPLVVLEALTRFEEPHVEDKALYLDGLAHLDECSAHCFEGYPNELSLGGLTELSLPVAKQLMKHSGYYFSLNGLKTLDLEIAEILSQYKGRELYLDGLAEIDEATALALASYQGKLSLNGIQDLSLPLAKVLSKHSGALHLNGIKHLNLEVAKELGRLSHLTLNGLSEIDVLVAEALTKPAPHQRVLDFLGLNRIRPPVAAILRQFSLVNDLGITNEGVQRKINTVAFGGGLEAVRQESPEWLPLAERNNFKDLVYQSGEGLRGHLREAGISCPEAFYNLNAGRNIGVLDEVIAFFQANDEYSEFLDEFERHTLKPFSNDSQFREVYLDEMIQHLATHLYRMVREIESKIQKKSASPLDLEERRLFLQEKIDTPGLAERIKASFRKNLAKLLSPEVAQETRALQELMARAEDLLAKMNHFSFIKPGESGFRLGFRNIDELSLGDQCSDCTSASIGGTNFWTVMTWLADAGCNFLLHYDDKGKLAHKFHAVFEVNGKDEIILTLDSMELGNEQKSKPGMYQKVADSSRERKLMDEAIAFVRDKWAQYMGLPINRVYATTISNTGTDELDGRFPEVHLKIAKLGGLEAARNLLNQTNPTHGGRPRIYLQSLQNEEEGDHLPQQADEELPEDGDEIPEFDKKLDFRRVEVIFRDYLEGDQQSSRDFERIKELLVMAQADPDKAARLMRIFLSMHANSATKEQLSVNGQRIDIFLNSRGHSLESYFKSILGQTVLKTGQFFEAKLYHLIPEKD